MKKSLINEWFNEAFYNKKYLEGYDIHINQIYPRIKKSDWIKKSIDSLNYFLKQKKCICPEMYISLSIRLEYYNISLLNSLKKLDSLPNDVLSITPPSYYLYDKTMTDSFIKKNLLNNSQIEKPEKSILSLYEVSYDNFEDHFYYLDLMII